MNNLNNLIPLLEGKGLFIFSDPGGSKPVLSYVKLNSNLKEFRIISDREYDFFSDFDLKVEKYVLGSEDNIINTFNPDFLFTGTSIHSQIELKFTKLCKEKQIKTYSFIDHYTEFLKRYVWNNDYCFSDSVCVIDDKAKEIALSLSIPSEIIVSGNYYHKYIKNWIPTISRDEFFTVLGIDKKNKLIVFAPDPISRGQNGFETYGFDEYSSLDSLMDALDKTTSIPYSVIIKMHPNQDKEKMLNYIKKYKIHIMNGDNFHTATLLYHADILAGMFSNILLEGSILGTKILRCMIGTKVEDPFVTREIGEVAYTYEELLTSLKKIVDQFSNE